MNAWRTAGLALFLVGFALLAVAVALGDVGFYLVVVVPVFASGSPLFGLGLLALVAGFFLVLLGGFGGAGYEPPSRFAPTPSMPPAADSEEERGGGMILIGPVPLFFGGWRQNAPIPYWVAVLAGALALAALFVLLALIAR